MSAPEGRYVVKVDGQVHGPGKGRTDRPLAIKQAAALASRYDRVEVWFKPDDGSHGDPVATWRHGRQIQ